MNDDDLLELATSALREEPVDPPVDPALTLRRIQSSVAQKNRRVRRMRTFLLPIAATLATSTAFAAATGKLTPVFRAVETAIFPSTTREVPVTPPPKVTPSPRATPPPMVAPPPTAAPPPQPSPGGGGGRDDVLSPSPELPLASSPATPETPAHAVSAPSPPGGGPGWGSSLPLKPPPAAHKPPPAPVNPAPALDPAPVPIAGTSVRETLATKPDASPAPVVAAPPAAPLDPTDDLYLRAHQMHFGKADPASTLASWDAYLHAAPNGRFAPEARFNRALVLVKLNRRNEAAAALAPFADGTYGGYRRNEARALLDVLRTPR
ncbi:hypothetical protein LVJ94_45340 [Pendulispora rubella]|uniref:Uncharacterized protein n=1 Tax=Pendulispora rubella TaxID=2741070 RepID=A0ABZ2KZK5_9BACT